METTANIVEVFYSIQGEGLMTGKPFLFIRFGGCNLNCAFCDTGHARVAVPQGKILWEKTILEFDNPLTLPVLQNYLNRFHFCHLTFTGGEPLLHSDFISALIDAVPGKFTLMETNGTLDNTLSAHLLEKINYWAVDIKLPSVSKENTIEVHRRFLGSLKTKNHVSLKVVFDPETPDEEIRLAFELARNYWESNPDTALVFQPATFNGQVRLGNNLQTIYALAENHPMDIRMIPQVHRLIGVL